MSQEEIKAEVCRQALNVCRNKRSSMLPQIFSSIESQLKWLVDFFEGKNAERKKLSELTFGHYAARELDPRESELIDALNKAFYVAAKTREGLKIDLKELGIDS
ncbi:MAG: hypothetical protein GY943_33895 [Chloroflexi bacterium]|nr:hypothetical protein [Chloroflexota bacterium]